jgi:hypothetical protein
VKRAHSNAKGRHLSFIANCFSLLQGTKVMHDAKGDWDSVSGTDSETLILRRLRSNTWREREPGTLSNKAFTCVVANAQGRAISQPVTIVVYGESFRCREPCSATRRGSSWLFSSCSLSLLLSSKSPLESLQETKVHLEQEYADARRDATAHNLPIPPVLMLPTVLRAVQPTPTGTGDDGRRAGGSLREKQ